MRRINRAAIFAALPLTLLVLLAGCDEDVTGGDEGAVVDFAAAAAPSQSAVLTFADLSQVGTSSLTRNSSGASATLHTSGLTPGSAYTMWMVIFNDPGSCSDDECGENDLFNPDAVVDVVYVAGNIAGGDGTSTFAGHRNVGDNSTSLFGMLGVPAPGLIDPHVAEMHLIVRDHGPALPGQIPGQIQTFEGACTGASSFGLGSGDYECEDVQFSIHQPPS